MTCKRGQTIVEAARSIGILIPTLCDEPRLPSVAACRICMVEVEGADKMVPGCATRVFDGMVVNTDTERVRELRHLYLELLLSDHNSFCTPPCQEACPTHIKIPQYLDYIAHGDYKNAVRKLREDLPFPAMLGRMCPRPCEGPCRRQLIEHPITICWLHRFAADECLEEEQAGELLLPWDPLPETGKRVAIIGAGPAGLAAAFYLRLEGHGAKIFEALPKPGGMMRYGIPNFHMSHDVMDKEMNVVWRLGAELQCNARLGVDFTLQDLFEKEGFDAVLLAIGAFGANDMGIPGEDAEGVRSASGYLEEFERNGVIHTGRRVAVIGGGYTAMDAVRTAVRTGAEEVTCFYRRSRTEMPSNLHGVDEAMEEGVKFELYTQPVRVVTDDQGKVVGLEMARMELGEPDASGRRRPVEIEGARYVYDCDQVLVATGQYPLLDGVPLDGGIAAGKGQVLITDEHTLQTGDPRVFAAGDAVLGAQTVIQAIAQGKKAAWSIDAMLRGEDMAAVSRQLAELKATPFYQALSKRKDLDPRIARMAELPPVFIDMTTDVSKPSPPADMPTLDMERRLGTHRGSGAGVQREGGAARRRAVPGLLLPGQRRLRPAALRHRVRGLPEPLPRRRLPRLRRRLPPRLHPARAQSLHQLQPLRAHLPRRGRRQLLRHHGARLRHHRQHARTTCRCRWSAASAAASAPRRAPPAPSRRTRACWRATTSTRPAACSAASASRSAPTTRWSRRSTSSWPTTTAPGWPASTCSSATAGRPTPCAATASSWCRTCWMR